MIFFAIALTLFLTVPFPIAPEPQAVSPKAVYDGFDTNVGVISTQSGVIGAGSGAIFFVNENGLIKKALSSKVKFLVQDGTSGLAIFELESAIKVVEIRMRADKVELVDRCVSKNIDRLVESTRLVSAGLIGFKTKSGGIILDAITCKSKRFDGDFTLGLPQDDSSGVPFIHNGSTYLGRVKEGKIDVVELNVERAACDKPVVKYGYALVLADGAIRVVPPNLQSAKRIAQSACGRADELFISTELDALFLPIDSGWSLYKLNSASKRWDHIVPGSARLLGLFGQDLFWAFGFERDEKNYVNLFRFRYKNAQLYGRNPLESTFSGRFAWSDKGFAALELDGRIAVYETVEIKPLFVVKIDAPLVDIVSHNGTFYALDNSGKLLAISP